MYIKYFRNIYKVYGTRPGEDKQSAYFLIYYGSFWQWVNAKDCTPIEEKI